MRKMDGLRKRREREDEWGEERRVDEKKKLGET